MRTFLPGLHFLVFSKNIFFSHGSFSWHDSSHISCLFFDHKLLSHSTGGKKLLCFPPELASLRALGPSWGEMRKLPCYFVALVTFMKSRTTQKLILLIMLCIHERIIRRLGPRTRHIISAAARGQLWHFLALSFFLCCRISCGRLYNDCMLKLRPRFCWCTYERSMLKNRLILSTFSEPRPCVH